MTVLQYINKKKTNKTKHFLIVFSFIYFLITSTYTYEHPQYTYTSARTLLRAPDHTPGKPSPVSFLPSWLMLSAPSPDPCAAKAPLGKTPHCAACDMSASASTSATMASTMGTARGNTQGSCRPLPRTRVSSPAHTNTVESDRQTQALKNKQTETRNQTLVVTKNAESIYY